MSICIFWTPRGGQLLYDSMAPRLLSREVAAFFAIIEYILFVAEENIQDIEKAPRKGRLRYFAGYRSVCLDFLLDGGHSH